nr:MAG TPA: hypothetical protein [Caudoviricetes sp.]DAS78470.1 MAG TPA: hypothetical protein [Caudoviricetes sp.]
MSRRICLLLTRVLHPAKKTAPCGMAPFPSVDIRIEISGLR